jgi:cell division protein FtsI (penicillin-binding protein 3)
MNAPRYAVYMMLDEPHGNKSTYGYATAGWVSAPAAGKVIARIGPMLGMLPDMANMPAINQSLAIPLQPGKPPGAGSRGPQTVSGQSGAPQATAAQSGGASTAGSAAGRSTLTVPPTLLPPALSRPPQREAPRHTDATSAGASLLRISTTPSSAGR